MPATDSTDPTGHDGRARGRLVVPAVVAAVLLVAGGAVAGALALRGETTGASDPGTAGGRASAAADDRPLLEQLYAAVAVDPGLAFVTFEADPTTRTVTAWMATGETDRATVRTATAPVLDRFDHELTIADDGAPQDAVVDEADLVLSDVATQVQQRLVAGGSGFSWIKLHEGLGWVTAWRTTPDPQVDAELVALGAEHGVTVQLLTARYTEEHLQSVMTGGIGWGNAGNGFEVVSMRALPDGIVVEVAGDETEAAAAREAYADVPEVAHVVGGASPVEPLPATAEVELGATG
ncbi:hypothetical protein ACOACO_08635 [Nocardioides sp. CPCC 205120]|uniref:hypothetical protein n=1 Tax=Nocardioides sp. CPCC 205120 TaxID=3406462 RepID=UPI003B504203